MGGGIHKCVFLLSKEMCQDLENLHYSMNQCFINLQYKMLQNHAWVKDPFKMQVNPIILI